MLARGCAPHTVVRRSGTAIADSVRTVRLSARQLNRTLLARQHLLERTDARPDDLVARLLGLQAQENLSPYLALHARLRSFDPHEVSRALEERRLVRLLSMRGTIHLLTPDDALVLRPWVQPRLEQELRSSPTVRPARDVDRQAFDAALGAVLADGPLPQRRLGELLAERFPGVPAGALGQLARVAAPLAQLPPLGCWKASGGIVYEPVDRWLGRPLVDPGSEGVADVVRRYLRAYGPATAADVSTWSGVTRLGPVLAGLPDLVRHQDADGRTLYDVPDGLLVPADAPAPVRLLGTYDEVWLAHAARDRLTEPAKRKRWMGANGGVGQVVLVDGWLEGLWRVVDGRVEVTELMRTLTPGERAGLDEEVDRVEALLAQ